MQISVAGERMHLSDVFRTRIATHLDTIAATYFDDALEGSVTFGQARSFFTCDINVYAGRGLLVHGEGEAADAPAAFDDAAEHIAKRLRRYRREMSGHACDLVRRRSPDVGREYVLRQNDDSDHRTTDGAAPPVIYATIVAQQDTEIALLTVGEAVMQLDLADRSVLMFRNHASGGINVVYRRPDGLVGWLDPDAPQR